MTPAGPPTVEETGAALERDAVAGTAGLGGELAPVPPVPVGCVWDEAEAVLAEPDDGELVPGPATGFVASEERLAGAELPAGPPTVPLEDGLPGAEVAAPAGWLAVVPV